jgi:uncharacterized membrane-anchored protein YhcB (DUF1043 family)
MAKKELDLKDIEKKAKETAEIVEDALRNISSQIGEIFQDALDTTSSFSKTLTNDITKGINNLAKTSTTLLNNQEKLSSGSLTRSQVEKQIAERTFKVAALQQQINIAKKAGLITDEEANEQLGQALLYEKEFIDDLNKQADLADKFNKKLGVTGAAIKGLNKIPILGSLINAETVLARIQKKTAEEGSTKFDVFKEGVKGVGSSMKDNLTDPSVLMGGGFSILAKVIQFFIDAMFAADKQVTDIAHNFNIVKEDAADTRDRFFEIKEEAGKFGEIQEGNTLLQKDLVKYNMELNEALGTSIDLSSNLGEEGKEIAVQFANASKFLKLGADEQKGLIESTAITGQNIDDTTKNILGTVRLRKLESGVLLDERKILKDVLTASNAIKLSVKGGAEGLTNAAMAAAKLGSDLGKVTEMSNSFLNFEESISAELEAELLTGKDLNLETARRAALNGDIETAAKEINKQIGTSVDFSNMNVIQQEALAKAMGTSRGELADMLVKQESLNSLKGTFNALSKQQLETMKTSGKIDEATFQNLSKGKASAGEYYAALKQAGLSTEDLTKNLGEVSLKALESQSAQDKFNETLENIKESFSKAFTGETIDKFANLLADFIKRWSQDGLFSAIFSSGGKAPTPEEKMANTPSEEASDFISRPGQPIQKFRKDDIIMGGTSLGGGGNGEITALLKELVAAVKAGGNVYLDGTKVGTAMNVSTYRVQ